MKYNKQDVYNYLHKLITDYNFTYFLNRRTVSAYFSWKNYTLKLKKSLIKSACGATKLVLYFNDIVLKIPLTGEGLRRINYCGQEAFNYKQAKLEKIDDFFCPCEFIGRYYYKKGHSFPVYAMERVDVNVSRTETIIDESYSNGILTASNDSDISEDEISVFAVFSQWYSEDRVVHLIDFLREYEVNDVHDANIGYTKDGLPVIIDYSGY